jgi:HD-like signal output (HDOD) protein
MIDGKVGSRLADPVSSGPAEVAPKEEGHIVNTSTVKPASAGNSKTSQQQIHDRIASLSYLPTTAAVALKFVELGKNPDAEPNDYAKVISADSSLSSKLLALANSSWAGVRNKVTTVKMAVNLLGLGTVRTLAISYCMAGLHNELRLPAAESQAFWEVSLFKAVAAMRYASLFNTKLADEAFVAGLFQDFALPVMYSVLRDPYIALLQNPEMSVEAQIHSERELVGMDHAEVGRMLAQKIELPECYVDAIAFHHDYGRLTELVTAVPIRDAVGAAAFLPHGLNSWNTQDTQALSGFLKQHAPAMDIQAHFAEVQTDLAELYAFFHEGAMPQTQLTEMMAAAASEVADNTTRLVRNINELLQNAASQGLHVFGPAKTR